MFCASAGSPLLSLPSPLKAPFSLVLPVILRRMGTTPVSSAPPWGVRPSSFKVSMTSARRTARCSPGG
eukprot:14025228-Heterocapsa_arctica.AAC.1